MLNFAATSSVSRDRPGAVRRAPSARRWSSSSGRTRRGRPGTTVPFRCTAHRIPLFAAVRRDRHGCAAVGERRRRAQRRRRREQAVRQLERLQVVGERPEEDVAVVVDGRAEVAGLRRAVREDVRERLDDVVRRRAVVAHVVAVDEVDRPVLAGADHQVRVRAGLVGKQQRIARAEVVVALVQRVLVERREVVGDDAGRRSS